MLSLASAPPVMSCMLATTRRHPQASSARDRAIASAGESALAQPKITRHWRHASHGFIATRGVSYALS
jgi:hypothetical protein